MTEYSKEQFGQFLDLLNEYESQVIEINAFAENVDDTEKTAQCFADSIMKNIPPQMTEPSINVYGAYRVTLTFKPINWNRVDVIYFKGEVKNQEIQVNYTGNVEENDTVTVAEMEARIGQRVYPPSLDNIEEGVPIVTPINFIGGKAKVTPDSYIYMDYLKATLEKKPELDAHIRGHVCCGNNMRISQARAKTVYKYLIKHGISKSRLSFKGYSNTKPVVWPEKTMEDRKANRRVDIIFTNPSKTDEERIL